MLDGIVIWVVCGSVASQNNINAHPLCHSTIQIFRYIQNHLLMTLLFHWLYYWPNCTNNSPSSFKHKIFTSTWIQGLPVRRGSLFWERCILLLSRFAVPGGHLVCRDLTRALSSFPQRNTWQALSKQSGGNCSVQLKRTALTSDENANCCYAEEAKYKKK